MNQTFTKKQQEQLEIFRKLEPYEVLTYPPRTYFISCHTCQDSREFHAVDSLRSFVSRHKGHSTYFKRVG